MEQEINRLQMQSIGLPTDFKSTYNSPNNRISPAQSNFNNKLNRFAPYVYQGSSSSARRKRRKRRASSSSFSSHLSASDELYYNNNSFYQDFKKKSRLKNCKSINNINNGEAKSGPGDQAFLGNENNQASSEHSLAEETNAQSHSFLYMMYRVAKELFTGALFSKSNISAASSSAPPAARTNQDLDFSEKEGQGLV